MTTPRTRVKAPKLKVYLSEDAIEMISEMLRLEYTPDARVWDGNSRSRSLARKIAVVASSDLPPHPRSVEKMREEVIRDAMYGYNVYSEELLRVYTKSGLRQHRVCARLELAIRADRAEKGKR